MLIQTENGLLNTIAKKPLMIWLAYIKNLNNIFVWLTIPLLIISSCIYLVFLPFYGLFSLLSFAQNFDEHNGWLLIIKIIFWLPSLVLIMFVYYPAMVIGGIMSIFLFPCDLVYNNKIALPLFVNELINQTVNDIINNEVFTNENNSKK